jgi:hypothetical protein
MMATVAIMVLRVMATVAINDGNRCHHGAVDDGNRCPPASDSTTRHEGAPRRLERPLMASGVGTDRPRRLSPENSALTIHLKWASVVAAGAAVADAVSDVLTVAAAVVAIVAIGLASGSRPRLAQPPHGKLTCSEFAADALGQ